MLNGRVDGALVIVWHQYFPEGRLKTILNLKHMLSLLQRSQWAPGEILNSEKKKKKKI